VDEQELRAHVSKVVRASVEETLSRESSVEEALAEMYLAGVSVRRVEDVTEALWGGRVSPIDNDLGALIS
jgi:transposase-like protein